MTLQVTSLAPSCLSILKEGKLSACLEDSSLFGLSFSEHIKADFSSSSLRCKKKCNPKRRIIKAQTSAVTTPRVTRSTSDQKKTLRKGSVIITDASSGLGLAMVKTLVETGKWHVIMACHNFLNAKRATKSAGMAKENYTIMHLDLSSLHSVRQFVNNFRQWGSRSIY